MVVRLKKVAPRRFGGMDVELEIQLEPGEARAVGQVAYDRQWTVAQVVGSAVADGAAGGLLDLLAVGGYEHV